jgi:hypothetical protein
VSLSAFRDYCRNMANDPDADARDALLWTQLADEVDVYLADNLDDPDGDPDLFA